MKRHGDFDKKYLCKPKITPMTLKKDMPLSELVGMYGKAGAFNAGRLSTACKIYGQMLKDNATICLTLAGAIVPAGMGGALAKLIESGLVDIIISTSANLYHDMHYALNMAIHQGDFKADDTELLKHGIIRIYDIFVPEKTLLDTDNFVRETFAGKKFSKPISTAEVHYELGKAILQKSKNPEVSILAMAAKHNVPVYCSAPGDGSIGLNLARLKLEEKGVVVDTDLDVLEATALTYAAGKTGVVILGGGHPKNFFTDTEPMLSQILFVESKGHDYFIQITTDSPHYGGCSGATPTEAVSWGKIDPEQLDNDVVVYCDSTIAAPIVFNYGFTVQGTKKSKQLYLTRQEAMEKLKDAFKRGK